MTTALATFVCPRCGTSQKALRQSEVAHPCPKRRRGDSALIELKREETDDNGG